MSEDSTAAAQHLAPGPTGSQTLPLLNRERSILQFNRRVLEQARREDVPLLERLRYVTIVSSNLDEFFEVRVADIIEATRMPGSGVTRSDLASVAQAAHEIIDEQYTVFNDVVMPALQRQGIVVLNHAERNKAQRNWVQKFFEQQHVCTPRLFQHAAVELQDGSFAVQQQQWRRAGRHGGKVQGRSRGVFAHRLSL